ncbi:MAG: hypothetical protein RL329_2992 [Bacteroidota bacterium]|jgi:hypothetical protein
MKKITEILNDLFLTNAEVLTEVEQKLVKGGGCRDDKRRERPGTVVRKVLYYFFDNN